MNYICNDKLSIPPLNYGKGINYVGEITHQNQD